MNAYSNSKTSKNTESETRQHLDALEFDFSLCHGGCYLCLY